MTLNPFFLQGSPNEQRLMQDLINESIGIYGINCYYMPRKYLRTNKIIRENVLAAFDEALSIEMYLETVDGFGGLGDLMSKFGVRGARDITLTVSRDRFENFITPVIKDRPNIKLATRPAEGDLIYFPLNDNLFEIKYVEGYDPFYQLQKNYIFKLSCELFEYEDEVIDTGVCEIDNVYTNQVGYTAKLNLCIEPRIATVLSGKIVNNALRYVGIQSGGCVTQTKSENGWNLNKLNPSIVFVPELIDDASFKFLTRNDLIYNIELSDSGLLVDERVGIDTIFPSVNNEAQYFNVGIGSNFINFPVDYANSNPKGLVILDQNDQSASIDEVIFTKVGFAYTQAPSVSFPNTHGAVGVTSLANGAIYQVNVVDAGCGYVNEKPIEITLFSDSIQKYFSYESRTGAVYDFMVLNAALQVAERSGISTEFPTFELNNEFFRVGIGTGYVDFPLNFGNLGIPSFYPLAKNGSLEWVFIKDTGANFDASSPPLLVVSEPPNFGRTTPSLDFEFNEVVRGEESGAEARVRDFNKVDGSVNISIISGQFIPGELIVGNESGAAFSLISVETNNVEDEYQQNDEFDEASEDIVYQYAFDERNPFGDF